MVTDAFNHAPGQIMMNTGAQIFGRPSMGAWVTYGLGSESQDLPGFVVFSTGKKGPSGGNSNWGSGFLPTVYQGVQFRTSGDPVLYLSNPRGVDADLQRDSLDAVRTLNQMRLDAVGDPEIATRINSFEMAFRMQIDRARRRWTSPTSRSTSSTCTAPSRASRRSPTPACWPAGCSSAACASCRSSTSPGTSTATSSHDLKKNCQDTDQACAALVKDLKQRGLLDDTLVIWGGEFGRTPMVQGGATTAATIIPTPSPCGWPAAASSRASPTARPTSSASTSSRTRSTSTTCTPRSCTCSASTTPS